MRQHFNNPWVVLGLCAVALLIMYMNAGDGTVTNVVPRQAISKVLPLTTTVDSPAMETVTMDVAQLDWPTAFQRDPFAPISSRVVSTQQGEDQDDTQNSGLRPLTDLPSSLLLTAVTLKPEPKMAMINRTLVAEGERIEGRRVTRIESDGVWLNGPSGPQHLVFSGKSRTSQIVERRAEVSTRPSQRSRARNESRRETSVLDGRDCSRSSTCS